MLIYRSSKCPQIKELDNTSLACRIILLIERAFSSVGRASPLQGEGREFESPNAHHKMRIGFFLASFYLKRWVARSSGIEFERFASGGWSDFAK